MKREFTIADILKSPVGRLNQHLQQQVDDQKKKESKYKNKFREVEHEGKIIKFRSEKEAGRFLALRMLLRANLIKDLKMQVPFELNEGGTHSFKYIADFTYYDNKLGDWVYVVEDSKGYRTEVYKKKKKLMEEVHKIKILET